tara:strand:+ start:4133 stop:5092 length:960 start_codon:yes stop_codon:yes gene_type:complete
MTVVRTVEEKNAELQERKQKQKELSKAIDKMVSDSISAQHGREMGCGGPGLCPMLGRGVARLLGLSRSAGGVPTEETVVSEVAKSSSVANRVFGKSMGKKATAAGKLESAKAAMQSRVEHLEEKAQASRSASVKAMKAQKKELALRELRRAKMMEKQANSTQSALDAVEQQFEMMEATALSREVASALGATAKSLKKNKAFLSQAEDSVDAAAEMKDLHDDMAQVMAAFGETANNNDYDDEELIAELEEMTQSPTKSNDSVSASDRTLAQEAQVALEEKHAEYDRLEELRQAMPDAPKRKSVKGSKESHRESLLASSPH